MGEIFTWERDRLAYLWLKILKSSRLVLGRNRDVRFFVTCKQGQIYRQTTSLKMALGDGDSIV